MNDECQYAININKYSRLNKVYFYFVENCGPVSVPNHNIFSVTHKSESINGQDYISVYIFIICSKYNSEKIVNINSMRILNI